MRAIAMLVVLGIGGCATTRREVADGDHLTDFQKDRLIGHYSTIDGKTGFVLDRTVDPPKARLDGDGTVHELAREGSVHGAFELVSADRKIWLRVAEESGEILLFDGPQQANGVDVIRDADAKRL
jgi:hypothetical protein